MKTKQLKRFRLFYWLVAAEIKLFIFLFYFSFIAIVRTA